jgi:hypothetical protein
MWKRKRKAEWLPWYRGPNYKGNMTEAEKFQLDAFRMQPTHPAAQWDALHEEVQSYINKIELELYDKKQEGAAGLALALSAIGAALLYLNYKGCFGPPTLWSYIGAGLLLVLPWLFYRHQWNKNADEFMPLGDPSDDAPDNATEERFREEWKLNYIVQNRQAERRRAERDASPQ